MSRAKFVPFDKNKMRDLLCDKCLCEDCWNNTDDCNECEEQRDKEQWCPFCDLPCVNMTPEEKKSHMESHKKDGRL